MFRNRARRRRSIVGALVVAATIASGAPSTANQALAGRQSVDPATLTATALTPASTITAAKSSTGRLAQTDPSLLGRTDATPVNVVVKLDYDATATYDGDIAGLPATSPEVTGEKLTGDSPAEVTYENYTGEIDSTFRSDLAAEIPSATAGRSLKRVYGGVAVTLPANQVGTLLTLPDVAAVRYLRLEFIGPKQLFLVASVDLTGDDVESSIARRLRRLERELETDPYVVDAVLTVSEPDEEGSQDG